MLHITDGESVAGTLRESPIPGDVSTYGDMMYEGPTPAGLDAEAWRETRSKFMAEAKYASLEECRQYLKNSEDTLAAFRRHDEVVLWLDHRLSNQLILIKVLDWFSHQDLRGKKLSLICIDRYPGLDPFIGLGALTARQLTPLADRRIPVDEAQYRTARAAWKAFTSPDPAEIERFIEGDNSALPFVGTALRRHLEQFPSLENGLSRTERQALSVLQAQSSLSGPKLFVAVQCMEDAVFMGDASFYRVIDDLSDVPHPLVQVTDAPQDGLGNVTITETGRKVLEGLVDHIALNGVDRWLGGVHLKGDRAAWRWDRAAGHLVKSAS
jgi:Domain of unknown function (DUF1835)